MSRTTHHGAPPRYITIKLPDKFVGWLFEGARTAHTRKWAKHLSHKAFRRSAKRDISAKVSNEE